MSTLREKFDLRKKHRGVFLRIFHPSFFSTFNMEVGSYNQKVKAKTERNRDQEQEMLETFGAVSPLPIAHQIISQEIDTRQQMVIIKKAKKLGYFYFIASLLSLFLFGIMVIYQIFQKEASMVFLSLIPATCFIQFLVLGLNHFHRAKQLLIGCAFPRIYLLSNLDNLLELEGDLKYFKKTVYLANPIWGDKYERLLEMEKKEDQDGAN
ncbi:hypothetical protein [Vibrio nigripulchritudo]|uniref:hypothetical protein n=1 Tax=Vibrio nigripulchritudo TaxID=28173 RepID=UPI00190C9142|nr:hypothetical protein [Vibrio nigripulchritudo]